MTKSLRLAASRTYSIVKEPETKIRQFVPEDSLPVRRHPQVSWDGRRNLQTAVAAGPTSRRRFASPRHRSKKYSYLPGLSCQADREPFFNFIPRRLLASDTIGADGVRTRDL
jgi:hypothetical protein